MTIKLKYDSTLGFYQVSGSISNTLAAFEVSPSQTGQNILSLDVDRAVSIKTSQTVGINEVSGSILSLKGRAEGLHQIILGSMQILVTSEAGYMKQIALHLDMALDHLLVHLR